ncbi:MAG: DsbE family thiol:disulfide interchange protein [Pseudomonadota bacterium]
MTKALLALPLVLFMALAAVFAFRVTDGADRAIVPSALIGKSVPDTTFPALSDAQPGLTPGLFDGKVTLVNVFASWCAPCRVEHPYLMALSDNDALQIVGINYKDRVPAARAFLAELGNPYDAIGVDPDNRRALEWGVYGVPETFVVGPDGVIAAKHVGELNAAVLDGPFGDALRALTGPDPATAGS